MVLAELQSLLTARGWVLSLPQLFVRGRLVEVRQLREAGELQCLLEGAGGQDPAFVCTACRGVRFVPCPAFASSRKVFVEEEGRTGRYSNVTGERFVISSLSRALLLGRPRGPARAPRRGVRSGLPRLLRGAGHGERFGVFLFATASHSPHQSASRLSLRLPWWSSSPWTFPPPPHPRSICLERVSSNRSNQWISWDVSR